MKIEIEIIPIEDMRYPTVGDYYHKEDGTLKIEIAETGKDFFNLMVLVHELVELALLQQRGVSFDEIDQFDKMFEAEREEHYHDLDDEPGFDPRSPYLREHTLATSVEMMMCAQAGINWNEYNETIVTL